MAPQTDGILLIDKGEGETSHDVVDRTRAAFGGKPGVRVGHAGTLDPFATGLLLILVGQGTKLSRFLMGGEKVYLGTLEVGVETDTLDCTGRVVAKAPVPALTREEVQEKADQFRGRVSQMPPAYSAVRCGGRRAYALARRGRAVDLRPREITIHSMEILWVDLPRIGFHVRCSSGTYVRRLASDLGKALGPGGHLCSLRRIRSGPFEVKDALSSAEIGQDPSLARRIIPLRDAIPEMREVVISERVAERVRQGWHPALDEVMPNAAERLEVPPGFPSEWVKLVNADALVAVGRVSRGGDRGGTIRIERVFSSGAGGGCSFHKHS